jgi:hypothetical protein
MSQPSSITEDQQSKIDYIIDSFNFEKIALVMQALDWGWAPEHGGKELSVPSVSRLKKTARYLLRSSIDANVVGSGGFRADYTPEDDAFSLCFIIEEHDSEFWLD